MFFIPFADMNTHLLCVVLLAVVLVLGAVCLWQRREIRRKRRFLTQFIKESVEYKRKYDEASYRYMLARLNAGHGSDEPGEPTAEAAAQDTGCNE